jgi:diguanylate cyclase (GGDEF)-like protein
MTYAPRGQHVAPGGPGGPAGSDPGVTAFARAWAKAIAGTSYVPMTYAEIEAYLRQLTRRLAIALREEPLRIRTGYEIGADLVAKHFASAEALGRTVEVVDLRLQRDLELVGDDAHDRVGRLLGAIAAGYARALRDRTLDEQESIRRAALVARQQAEQALRVSEARFRHQATHDPLTGLPNRAMLSERLNRAFADGNGRRVGVCFVDLDGFKVVNDSLGHAVGDRLLATVAHRLDERLTGTGHLVARMGGDEFVILVEGTTGTDDVTRVADTALAAVAEPVHIDGHDLSVSASIGVVEQPVAHSNPSELMRAADITLNWAKSAGKGRWAIFDPRRNDVDLARYALSAAMPGALDRNEFFVDYQPMVSLADGALVGVEALVRWQHPRLGLLPPDRFVGLAEETGLIVKLGGWVLDEACRQAARWHANGDRGFYISVNLAMRQVHDPALVDTVLAVLDRTGLRPGSLQLEITESAAMNSDDEPVAALRALAARGVRIAIDDFGTGYSNLGYLRTLPVRELKIAGSFVHSLRSPDATGNPTDECILASLVSLAHTLGLTVTAEGVETPEQADRLRAIGCDAAQGWLFGRPGPPEQIAAAVAPAPVSPATTAPKAPVRT